MNHKKCARTDCTSITKKMAFPKPYIDKNKYLQWLYASGNTSLLSVSEDKIHNRTVCEEHFENKYKFSKN